MNAKNKTLNRQKVFTHNQQYSSHSNITCLQLHRVAHVQPYWAMFRANGCESMGVELYDHGRSSSQDYIHCQHYFAEHKHDPVKSNNKCLQMVNTHLKNSQQVSVLHTNIKMSSNIRWTNEHTYARDIVQFKSLLKYKREINNNMKKIAHFYRESTMCKSLHSSLAPDAYVG